MARTPPSVPSRRRAVPVAVVLALPLALSLAACGGASGTDTATPVVPATGPRPVLAVASGPLRAGLAEEVAAAVGLPVDPQAALAELRVPDGYPVVADAAVLAAMVRRDADIATVEVDWLVAGTDAQAVFDGVVTGLGIPDGFDGRRGQEVGPDGSPYVFGEWVDRSGDRTRPWFRVSVAAGVVPDAVGFGQPVVAVRIGLDLRVGPEATTDVPEAVRAAAAGELDRLLADPELAFRFWVYETAEPGVPFAATSSAHDWSVVFDAPAGDATALAARVCAPFGPVAEGVLGPECRAGDGSDRRIAVDASAGPGQPLVVRLAGVTG
jgi:hypothetical protein